MGARWRDGAGELRPLLAPQPPAQHPCVQREACTRVHACARTWERIRDEGARRQGCSSWGPARPNHGGPGPGDGSPPATTASPRGTLLPALGSPAAQPCRAGISALAAPSPLPRCPKALLFRMTPVSAWQQPPSKSITPALWWAWQDRDGEVRMHHVSQGKSPGSALAPCPQALRAACWREQLPALFRLQHTHLSCIRHRGAAGFSPH